MVFTRMEEISVYFNSYQWEGCEVLPLIEGLMHGGLSSWMVIFHNPYTGITPMG